MVPNGCNGSQFVSNDFKSSPIVSNDPKRFQAVPNCPKWLQMVSNCLKMFQILSNEPNEHHGTLCQLDLVDFSLIYCFTIAVSYVGGIFKRFSDHTQILAFFCFTLISKALKLNCCLGTLIIALIAVTLKIIKLNHKTDKSFGALKINVMNVFLKKK